MKLKSIAGEAACDLRNHHLRVRHIHDLTALFLDSPVSAREVPPLGSRAHRAGEGQPQPVSAG